VVKHQEYDVECPKCGFEFIALREVRDISKATKEGMGKKKRQFKRFSSSIYGWDCDENNNLTPNENEQKIIHWMKARYDAGVPAATIARQNNEMGFKGKRGGKWTSSGVLRCIRNPFHEGVKEFKTQ